MTQQHPITPPPELVAAWCRETDDSEPMFPQVAAKAAQWGAEQAEADIERKRQEAADQELEACCEWMFAHGYQCGSERIRKDRRPKPLSLKKQAIALIDSCADPDGDYLDDNALTTIRRALEQLPDEQ